MAFGMMSQLVGTMRAQCPDANSSAMKMMPLISHSMSTPRCHQRARPIEWRRPGSPTWSGSVSESAFAVYDGSSGTGFWNRSHSRPGTECRDQ